MPEEVSTVVVKREGTGSGAESPNTVTASTPASWSNVTIKALSPVRVILTRVARVYVQSLSGMLAVVMTGIASDALITPVDFIGKLKLAAGFALAPAIMALLQNLTEVLTKLDQTRPELRA